MRSINTTVEMSPSDAEAAIRAALGEQGFGVLTEIDVAAVFQAKLGIDRPFLKILGACNPTLAHKALGVQPQIGMLLPCNVVVRADTADESGRTMIVEAMNPDLMVSVTGESGLEPVASQAAELLGKAIAALGEA